MEHPADLVPNIRQFTDDPEEFWAMFVEANPAPPDLADEVASIWHRQRFAKRYAHCFASVLGAGHPYDAYNLPAQVKTAICKCMLAAEVSE